MDGRSLARTSAVLVSVVSLFGLVGAQGAGAAAPAALSASPVSSASSPLILASGDQTTITITNTGGSNTAALKATLAETPGNAGFSIASDGCDKVKLAPQKTCTVRIKYSSSGPSADETAVLTVASGTATSTKSYFKAPRKNTAPVGVVDAFIGFEDSVLSIPASGVLLDDYDREDDRLTAVLTTAPAHGTLNLRADGSFVYTPALNFNGLDWFTYRASDGSALSNISVAGILVLPVNDRPIAVADANTVKEDTLPNPVTGNVLGNDSDVDGDSLSVTNAGTFNLGHGTLVLNANGTYAFTLDNTNPAVQALNDGQRLTDTFTYNVSDGHGGTASAALTVTINGTTDNAAPVADGDTASVREDTAPNPVTGNVLTNDTDPNGDALSVTNPGTFNLGHGTLVINANGTYTFTLDNTNPAVQALNDGQTLTDMFTYGVSDGHGGTDTARLTITIRGTTDNVAPTAVDDEISVKENVPPNPVTGNVLGNDTDPNGDDLELISGGGFTLAFGTLAINIDGSYAYTLDNSNPAVNALNDGQTLTDAFTYTITDSHGGSDSATLRITINGTTD